MTVRLQPRPIGDTWRFFLREMSGDVGVDLSVYSDISCQIRIASTRALFATPTIILADQTSALTRGSYELRVDAATTEGATKGLHVFDVQVTDSLGIVTTLHVPPLEFEAVVDVTKLAADPPVAPPPTFTGDGTRLLMRTPLGVYTSIRIEPDGAAAPTVTDDEAHGYATGSWWLYAGDMWICRDATTGAAVWVMDAAPSDENPLASGVAWPGTSTEYARGDHVHPPGSQAVQDIAITSGATLATGDAVALVAGRVQRSDARAGSVVVGYIGQCLTGGTGDAGGTVLARVVVSGIAPASGLTAGLPVYLSTSAIGAVTTAAPSGLGALSQIVGRALSATTFALQVDAASTVDWCSPLDIPTSGIFYGRASSANLLASGRITTNGIADLFGTGRFATVDGAGSAPAFISGGGPGSDAWFFVKATRADRLRVVHDAGMTGVAWSGISVNLALSASFSSVLAKCNGSTPQPFDFGQSGGESPYLAGDGLGTFTAKGWRADGFSRSGNVAAVSLWSRGSMIADGTSTTYSAGTNDITIGNRQDLANGFDGRVAAFAVWNRALTAAEQSGLAKWARREWAL
jgi:hypothetical protein